MLDLINHHPECQANGLDMATLPCYDACILNKLLLILLMKAKIHPEYFDTTITCACGNKIETGSTQTDLHVEICAACHPFYTGKQKLVDTARRVEKYQAKMKKAAELKNVKTRERKKTSNAKIEQASSKTIHSNRLDTH